MEIFWPGQLGFAGESVTCVPNLENRGAVAFSSPSIATRNGTELGWPDPSFLLPPVRCAQIPVEVPKEISFYGSGMQDLHFLAPERPLRALFLTSIRDVGKVEKVGTLVQLHSGAAYMCGTLETALRESAPGGLLHSYLEIAAVVTDDHPSDLRETALDCLPGNGAPWIAPVGLRNQSGQSLEELAVNIPSLFRFVPKGDTARRQALKLDFEMQVYQLFKKAAADIVIVDHYMARLDYLITPAYFHLDGRVLNTHPGITRKDSPYTCPGKDCDFRAIEHAQGRRLDPQTGRYRQVDPHYRTGASFHMVSDEIDAGQVLCDSENTPVTPNDYSLELIHRNYVMSKNPVFLWGARHYASHLWPRVY